MQYDRKITIATAGTRRATSWPAATLMWSEFCERLKTPIRSSESYDEYLNMKKSQQDELKDVGGFVAGWFEGDRRKAANVVGRDVVTLDLDNIPAGGTDDVLNRVRALGPGYCVYSTRKHHPGAPRLRVLIPTNRTMSAEEYEPIARMTAKLIGIEFADPTTFEASRLMYWPSCSADGVYIHEAGDKPFLSADGMLDLYQNWRDFHEWPQVPGAPEALSKRAEKQQDPAEKTGTIGAFCQVYDVPAAISTFLPDAYVEDEQHPGRYTYTGGSTSGGAVVYDDGKFLYSHHATDPTSGQLVNAFDLVRLHKFGGMDEEAKADTPVNRLPSFLKMCEFALEDENVKTHLFAERRKNAQEAFDELEQQSSLGMVVKPLESEMLDWQNRLESHPRTGKFLSSTANVTLILNNDSNLKGKLAFDEFSNRGLVLGPLPWNQSPERRDWADSDDAGLRLYLEAFYDISGKEKIADAITNVAMMHRINEVKGFLNSARWDGHKRVETVLIEFFGAEDSVYTREVTKKFFAATAARVFEPGIKFDYMLILSGPQGCGKSTFFYRLGRQWYSDSLTTFEGKEASEAVQGCWIIEVSELDSMRRSEVNAVKHFLSKQDDIYREPYGRRTIKFPRRCTIVGTTNDNEFLKDRTGNRRFWPVDLDPTPAHTKHFFENFDDEYVTQLWAEAVVLYRSGEKLYLTGDAAQDALKQQAAHSESNPKEGLIEEFLNRWIPDNWDELSIQQRRIYLSGGGVDIASPNLVPRDRICAAEIWVECFNSELRFMRRQDSIEINSILDYLPDWERNKSPRRFGDYYGNQRGYQRDVSDMIIGINDSAKRKKATT